MEIHGVHIRVHTTGRLAMLRERRSGGSCATATREEQDLAGLREGDACAGEEVPGAAPRKPAWQFLTHRTRSDSQPRPGCAWAGSKALISKRETALRLSGSEQGFHHSPVPAAPMLLQVKDGEVSAQSALCLRGSPRGDRRLTTWLFAPLCLGEGGGGWDGETIIFAPLDLR